MTQLHLKKIHRWHKEYEWLSNNYLSPIMYSGDWYPTVTHAFLASKTKDPILRAHISKVTVSELDKLWSVVGAAYNGWHASTTMKELMEIKFGVFTSGDPKDYGIPMYLLKKLIQTGDALLVFGNRQHDMFWGQCICGEGNCLNYIGKNLLGYTIMGVRHKLNDRIKIFGGQSDYCECGSSAENTVMYTEGWLPKLKSYCSDAKCVTRAMEYIQVVSTDGITFPYPPDGTESLEMPPLQESRPVNEIIIPKAVTQAPVETDDDEDEFFSYDYFGGKFPPEASKGPYASIINRPSTVKVTSERTYETLVIQGK